VAGRRAAARSASPGKRRRRTGAKDRIKVTQLVAAAVPVRVLQATLMPSSTAFGCRSHHRRSGPARCTRRASAAASNVAVQAQAGRRLPGMRRFFETYPYTCLEQKTSTAIGLRTRVIGKASPTRCRLYLDSDGLANYFPPRAGGANTAAIRSPLICCRISDARSRLRYDLQIPPRHARQDAGRIAFVEGRIERDFWSPAFLKNGDLDVRKLAALEALSAHGRAQPKMLGSINLPNPGRPAAVIDWLNILDRVDGIPERANAFEEASRSCVRGSMCRARRWLQHRARATSGGG
jgi:hypothetical protein